MTDTPITQQDVYRARAAIAPLVRRTPLVTAPSLGGSGRKSGGPDVFLKLECLQQTGSFKLRGAANRLAMLTPEERSRGVVTVSTGNHGRAVAHAARRLGIRAVVCMSNLVPGNKVEAIGELGAEIRIHGRSQDEAEVEARRLEEEEGLVLVPPFDDRHVIAGQGTIGLELLEDLPDLDTVLVPLSGGGLIAGVALAVKTAAPGVRIVGISMERGPAMIESLRAGRPVAVEERESLADSLGGGIGSANRFTFAMVRDLVDELVLVGEGEIAAAMTHLFRHERLVVEGAAAVGAAALMAGRLARPGRTVAAILSGGNVDMDVFTGVVTGKPRSEEAPV
ncbi:MAG TPA: hydroxyectoine utilization dehydratase EutB [Arenibaculum sp.]|nr:hydroxyectoine utilization dehydratase EutB [Arenibaculum sp.]